MNKYYVGTELKFAIMIASEGFDMNTDPWKIKVINGQKILICDEENNTAIDSDNLWYILVNTTELGAGTYYLIAEIDVPDNDFEDGYRHEVLKWELPLCNILKI